MTMFTFDEGEILEGAGTAGNSGSTKEIQIESPEALRPSSRAVNGLRTSAASPPIRIASQSPMRLNSLTVGDDNDVVKLDLDKVRKKAAKKKRRNQAQGPAAAAVQTIRGFQTPLGSGGEESDFSVASTPKMGPRRDFSSVASSPAMRPMTPSGISTLKLKLDSLSIGNRSPCATPRSLRREFSNTGSSGSDSDKTEMDTYEVPLDQDFVSPDVRSRSFLGTTEGGIKRDTMVRKMAAEDFEPLKCLGKGSFGTVHLVRQQNSGRLFAQKQFKKASLVVHKRLVEQTKTERQILESVNRHPFVVKLFYAFQDHEKLYLILEYAQGGELFHHLKMERMFDEPTAAFYMAEMILALEHLHRNLGVVYRDLKPENCLLDAEGHLLLTDFGLSKVSVDDDTKCNSFLGTVDYMAPEIIAGKEYSFAVDWWSLGALAFDLLTGKPPFGGNNNAKIEQAIVHKKLVVPYFLGPNAKDVLIRFLRKEPQKRLGYNMPKDLTTMKNHGFFKAIDWRKLARREVEPPIQPLITDPELAENFDEEFTDLAVSPVVARKSFSDALEESLADQQANPFGGFSFVASESLLASEDFLL
ncbi:serine/threonine-protein kinase-like protein psk1 [Venturia nashicola]|uniref:Serine/threonine-protein kinase-like protein psk1 n=1 Tax=Venturia nashicola TaxID=86259 RepID=A0A4Z1PI79_9PEZI|nr:serine/threonine-protein kinase-like protein psk1 [Venturia nashicola]